MSLIADILLISGAFGAALYCAILSRRLSRLSDLDGGVGKAISELNAKVADLSQTLQQARGAAETSAGTLDELTRRGEAVAASLEALIDQARAEVPGPGAKASAAAPAAAPEGGAAPAAGAGDRPAMPAFIRGRAVRTAAE